MPIRIVWDNEAKSIIRSTGEDDWTWEQFHEGLQKIVVMMQSVDQRVDLIHDHAPGSRRPEGSGMPHYQRAMRLMPPNIGLTIFVNPNTFGRAIVSIFTRLYGNRSGGQFLMASSLEDARRMIEKDRKEKVSHAS